MQKENEQNNNSQEQPTQLSLNDQMQRRLEERQHLIEAGINPYPTHFEVTHSSVEIIDDFEDEVKKPVSVAGRIMTIRKMGKPHFSIFRTLLAGSRFT